MYRPASTLLVVALLGVSLAGQQPPPQPVPPGRVDGQIPPITFRSEVNYVEVDAVVQDAQGNFVRNLGADDFQVFEDGTPQRVSAFAYVNIPVERAERPLFSPRAIEPDVRVNTEAPSGRVYVLLLDDLHTSASRTPRVREAARQFIETNLGTNDIAAVVQASGRTDASQDFTNNKRLLSEAVGKFMGRKLRSATLNRIDSYYQLTSPARTGGKPMDAEEFERARNARSILATITSLSDFLAAVHGRRKALVFVSEGIDYDVNDVMANQDATTILNDTRDAIAAATRANVSIYALDPRGLVPLAVEGAEVGSLPTDTSVGLGVTAFQNELRLSQDSLRTLAEETGGFAAVSTNDVTGPFQRIVDENSSYYVLGYYPTNDKRDGRFRKIEVRLTRPGLQVRARKGYVAPRGKAVAPKGVDASGGTSPELRDALNSPLQMTGLALSVFAAPFRGPAPKASVAVVAQFRGRDLAFTERDGTFGNVLEVSCLLLDAEGKSAGGSRETLKMALKPETYQRVMQIGFRMQMNVDALPGRYTLRVAARESGGRVGSVHYDLIVPDFGREPLSMSGLAIASAQSGQIPTAGVLPEIRDLLPAPPTTARDFKANDELAVLAEVYDSQGAQAHSVYITATLRSDEGRVVFNNEERRLSSELGGARGGYGYVTRIPLKDLAPGLYVLKVEARSSLGRGPVVAREVQLRITS